MKKALLFLIALITTHATFAACTASFTNTIGTTGLTVTINNTSSYGTLTTGQSKRTIFDFGDGTRIASMGNSSSQAHTYATTGVYTLKVVIMVVDSVSTTVFCSDSTTQSVTINYGACYSTFTTTKVDDSTFDFVATTPAGTSGMTYSWTFSSGTPLTATGASVRHMFAYSANNIYTAALVAASSASGGCTYNTSKSVPVVINRPIDCNTLFSSFTYSHSNGSVSVNNTSTYRLGTARTATYDYGDGTGTTSATYHQYATGGTYIIQQTTVWTDSLNPGGSSCTKSSTQSVNVTTPVDKITGYVLDSPSTTNSDFKVWLIRYDSSSGAASATLTAVDSTTLTNCGYNTLCNYTFNNAAPGIYFVKAAQVSATPHVIPTYGTTSFNAHTPYWSGASRIYHYASNSNFMNIYMIPGTPGSGPGFIGGSISAGANRMGRTTGAGSDMEVLLRNNAGDAIAFTKTDAVGAYSFSNIPVGTYSVYPEIGGYTTVAATVTITGNEPSVNNIYFHVNTTTKLVTPTTTGMATVNKADALSIYPSPTTGIVNIQGLQKGLNNVVVTDVTGRIVLQTAINYISGASTVDLSAADAGIYFISIKAESMNYCNKIVLQQ